MKKMRKKMTKWMTEWNGEGVVEAGDDGWDGECVDGMTTSIRGEEFVFPFQMTARQDMVWG